MKRSWLNSAKSSRWISERSSSRALSNCTVTITKSEVLACSNTISLSNVTWEPFFASVSIIVSWLVTRNWIAHGLRRGLLIETSCDLIQK